MMEGDDLFELIKAIPKYEPALDVPLPDASKCKISCGELLQILFTQENFHFPYEISTEVIEELFENLPASLEIEALLDWEEKMSEASHSYPEDLRIIFLRSEPKTIAMYAGMDVLLWANLTSDLSTDSHHNAFLRYYGQNADRLRVAAKTIPIIEARPNDPHAALKTYELAQIVTDEYAFPDFLKTISKFVSQDTIIDPNELAKFTIEGVVIPDGPNPIGKNHKYGKVSWDVPVGGLFYQFFLDAPVALVLCFESRPIAVCAAYVVSRHELLINQLHPIRPREIVSEKNYDLEAKSFDSDPPELEIIAWNELLISTFAAIAKTLGLKKIGLQSALNNRWVMPDNRGEIDVSPVIALKMYDQTARSLGMKIGSSGNYWIDTQNLLNQR